jgi:nicotinic acid mononucleotide adenylyltransferase
MKSLEHFIDASIGDCKGLGWFGFSADPPTLAHRAVIDAALGSGLVQKIVAFPAGKLPYKLFSASDWQRWDMTELWRRAAEWEDEVVLSRFDLLRSEAMTWIDLWRKITQLAPSVRHSLIVGSDQYGSIGKTWIDGEKLMKSAHFIIVPRAGYPINIVHEHHHLLTITPIPGASTNIRKGDMKLVDERVRGYIIDNQMYK